MTGPATQGIDPGDLTSALEAVDDGAAYANIHTTKFPGGEIRGQVRRGNKHADKGNGNQGDVHGHQSGLNGRPRGVVPPALGRLPPQHLVGPVDVLGRVGGIARLVRVAPRARDPRARSCRSAPRAPSCRSARSGRSCPSAPQARSCRSAASVGPVAPGRPHPRAWPPSTTSAPSPGRSPWPGPSPPPRRRRDRGLARGPRRCAGRAPLPHAARWSGSTGVGYDAYGREHTLRTEPATVELDALERPHVPR